MSKHLIDQDRATPPGAARTPKTPRGSKKSPLSLHPNGQYYKKIHGRFCYFGRDKEAALREYYTQAAELHLAKGERQAVHVNLTVRDLCNLFLAHYKTRVANQEVKQRQYYDRQIQLRIFAEYIGPDRLANDVETLDVQNFRKHLIDDKHLAPNTVNNYVAAAKAMYHWADDNDIRVEMPKLRAIHKTTVSKIDRQVFALDQVGSLLRLANPRMRAMIMLGLNCGFGCTDCAELEWKNLDLENRRVNYPRGKTGVGRNFDLWPETVEAIKAVGVQGDLVFYTVRGNPYVQQKAKWGKAHDAAISKEFAKLLKKAGIARTHPGTGFYSLRRTGATMTAQNSKDMWAVRGYLGHSTLEQATTYVQDTSPQTNEAIRMNHEKLVGVLQPPQPPQKPSGQIISPGDSR
jgi:integrase